MNIFWLLSLIITTTASIFLFLFFISFFLPKGTKLSNFIAKIIFRLWIPILSLSGIFILLIVQEIGAINHVSQQYYQAKNGSASSDNLFFYAAELFRTQRNFYISILGLLVLFSLLIISWQVHSWTKKNEQLQGELHSQ